MQVPHNTLIVVVHLILEQLCTKMELLESDRVKERDVCCVSTVRLHDNNCVFCTTTHECSTDNANEDSSLWDFCRSELNCVFEAILILNPVYPKHDMYLPGLHKVSCTGIQR